MFGQCTRERVRFDICMPTHFAGAARCRALISVFARCVISIQNPQGGFDHSPACTLAPRAGSAKVPGWLLAIPFLARGRLATASNRDALPLWMPPHQVRRDSQNRAKLTSCSLARHHTYSNKEGRSMPRLGDNASLLKSLGEVWPRETDESASDSL
jgi:hypothetical protein